MVLIGLALRLSDRIVVIVNALGFIVLVWYSCDLAVFYICYEVLSVLIVPVLLSSSRSVRRGYALVCLYTVNMIGLLCFLLLSASELSVPVSSMDLSRSSVTGVLLTVLVAAKAPSYPLSF
jgi:hypothetical protein